MSSRTCSARSPGSGWGAWTRTPSPATRCSPTCSWPSSSCASTRPGRGAEGFAGRFQLELADPHELWSVEPGIPAPARWALLAGPDGLRARAGACLDADASLRASVDTCVRLVAGDSQAALEIEVEGDEALALGLLDLLGAPASAQVAAA